MVTSFELTASVFLKLHDQVWTMNLDVNKVDSGMSLLFLLKIYVLKYQETHEQSHDME